MADDCRETSKKKTQYYAYCGIPAEKYKNTPILSTVFFLLLLHLCGRQAQAVMMDRSGASAGYWGITITEVNFTGHTFQSHSPKRQYSFQMNYQVAPPADVATTQKGGKQSCTTSWDSSVNHFSIKCGSLGEARYQCDHADPMLGEGSFESCKVIYSQFNQWEFERDLNNYLKNSCLNDMWGAIKGGSRTSMRWEALAKSMNPVPPGQDIVSPSQGAVKGFPLIVEVATDVTIPTKTKIDFILKDTPANSNYQKIPTLLGQASNTWSAPLKKGKTMRWINEELQPSMYSFHTKMLTSLTSTYDSNKVYFKVIPNNDFLNNKPQMLAPKNNAQLKMHEPVHFHALFSQPDADFTLIIERKTQDGETWNVYSSYEGKANRYVGSIQYGLEGGRYRVRADNKNPYKTSEYIYFNVGKTIGSILHQKFSILNPSPLGMDSYANTIPVKIMLPKELKNKSTLTFNWSWGWNGSASTDPTKPPQTSLLPKQFLSQTVSVSPGLTYETTMDVAKLIKAKNNTIKNDDKIGYYQLQAVLKTKKGEESKTSGSFTVGLLGKAVQSDQGKKKDLPFSLNVPILTSPIENQIFMVPARIQVQLMHKPKTKVVAEMQYSPFSKDKKAILFYTPVKIHSIESKTENGSTTLVYAIKKPGFYQIRARNNEKMARYSDWRHFKVIQTLWQLNLINKKQIKPSGAVQKLQTTQVKHPEVTVKDIGNVQTMTAVKPIHKITRPLTIMPLSGRYLPSKPIKIIIKNTPFKRIPFELQYRPNVTGFYRQVQHPVHSFTKTNAMTTLILNLKTSGQYQVRFRADQRAPWTHWHSFQVREKEMQLSPGSAGSINPQPEPPGKHIKITPPTIQSPRNGQKILLTGKTMHVKAKISHTTGQRVQVEVQIKQGGHFITLKKGVHTNRMKTATTVDMLIMKTGDYRIRIKALDKKSPWSKWTNFIVWAMMKNPPKLKMPKTTIKPAPHLYPVPPRIK